MRKHLIFHIHFIQSCRDFGCIYIVISQVKYNSKSLLPFSLIHFFNTLLVCTCYLVLGIRIQRCVTNPAVKAPSFPIVNEDVHTSIKNHHFQTSAINGETSVHEVKWNVDIKHLWVPLICLLKHPPSYIQYLFFVINSIYFLIYYFY